MDIQYKAHMFGFIVLFLFCFITPGSYGIVTKGVVYFQGAPNQAVHGNVTVLGSQAAGGWGWMYGTIYGLSPGLHGFHVHQHGNITADCKGTGSHYNPANVTHGGLDGVRHAGDLGNIMADNFGVARVNIKHPSILLNGPRSILGRGIVIHAGEDNLGYGLDPGSKSTGNAGARVACGVIAIAEEYVEPVQFSAFNQPPYVNH